MINGDYRSYESYIMAVKRKRQGMSFCGASNARLSVSLVWLHELSEQTKAAI
jgi:hypothetical protein